jgi:hypothetical protein
MQDSAVLPPADPESLSGLGSDGVTDAAGLTFPAADKNRRNNRVLSKFNVPGFGPGPHH